MSVGHPPPSTWNATAVGHLQRLAAGLVAVGLCPDGRYDTAVPELRISHPDLPSFCLVVTAIERANGRNARVWLFHLSTGVLTSPCDDIPAAVQDVRNALRPIYEALIRRANR